MKLLKRWCGDYCRSVLLLLKEDCDIKSEPVDSENVTGQVDGDLCNRTLHLTKDEYFNDGYSDENVK